MRLRPYAKVAAATDPTGAVPGGRWVALEKVHGAQLVIAVGGEEVRFAKRKAWLAEDDPFFGWQLLRHELTERARQAAAAIGAPTVVLYGELFGGAYPHPDVPAVPGLQAVQTGIWYAPGLAWAVFDALVAVDDADDGELLAFHELAEVATATGLLVPPTVATGRRTEVERAPARFPTMVPALLGLPPIDGNVAEGIVIRRDAREHPARRTSSKRKIPEFDEQRFGESERWERAPRPDPGELEAWARRLTNPMRVASAASKWGREDLDAVLDEVELDVLIDLADAFPEVAASPTPEVEAALRHAIRTEATRLI